jgi:DNA mismatch repair ATPase MutS
MRTWFLRPVVNLGTINSRQDAVELLMAAPQVAAALRELLAKVIRALTRLLLL